MPRPINRFTELNVFSGSIDDFRYAFWPTKTSLIDQKYTTEGSKYRSSLSNKTSGVPLLTEATRELVVPRSIPAALRCKWGLGDFPGSDICNKTTSLLFI